MKNNGKQLPSVAIGQELDVYTLVLLFKQTGGNLNSFFKRLPGIDDKQSFLSRLVEELEQPEHSELKKIWESAITRGDYVRRLLIRDKAWTMAEKWQNPSETSGATEVSFIAKVLSLDLAGNEQKVPYEQQAKLDDEADGILEQLGTREDGNEDSQQQISTQLDDETPIELTMKQKIYEAEQDLEARRTQRICGR